MFAGVISTESGYAIIICCAGDRHKIRFALPIDIWLLKFKYREVEPELADVLTDESDRELTVADGRVVGRVTGVHETGAVVLCCRTTRARDLSGDKNDKQ